MRYFIVLMLRRCGALRSTLSVASESLRLRCNGVKLMVLRFRGVSIRRVAHEPLSIDGVFFDCCLGVAVGLGVAMGLGVAVGLGVALGLGIAVGLGVALGLGDA